MCTITCILAYVELSGIFFFAHLYYKLIRPWVVDLFVVIVFTYWSVQSVSCIEKDTCAPWNNILLISCIYFIPYTFTHHYYLSSLKVISHYTLTLLFVDRLTSFSFVLSTHNRLHIDHACFQTRNFRKNILIRTLIHTLTFMGMPLPISNPVHIFLFVISKIKLPGT